MKHNFHMFFEQDPPYKVISLSVEDDNWEYPIIYREAKRNMSFGCVPSLDGREILEMVTWLEKRRK